MSVQVHKADSLTEQASLPARVKQQVEEHQLGQCRAVYRRRGHKFLSWSFPLWAILGCIWAIGSVALPLSLALGVNISDQVQTGLDLFISGILMVFGIMELLRIHPFHSSKIWLYIMDDGLLYINGKLVSIVRWDDVKEFFWTSKHSISHLTRKDAPRFDVIMDMEKRREISTLVANALTDRMLLDMLKQYQTYGKVQFGRMAVAREGITNWDNSGPRGWSSAPVIPWKKIQDVRFVQGKVAVQVDDRWKYWRNGLFKEYVIANPTVCVALIRHILENEQVIC